MLPYELSTNLCSLVPQRTAWCCPRCWKSTIAAIVVAQEFTRGVIRSAERMTYTNVHLLLEGDAGHARALRRRWSRASS